MLGAYIYGIVSSGNGLLIIFMLAATKKQAC